MACRSLLYAACFLATAAFADDPAWQQAAAIVQATNADVAQARSLQAIAPHTDALEKALAEGAAALAPPAPDGKTVVLADGPAEALAAMGEAIKNGQSAVARPNPYPDIALFLALYYNEVHRYDDALRVIEAGLKLAHSQTLGTHLPHLYSERATAYAQLRRFDEALTTYDAAMTLAADTDADKARFLRGRGYVLTERGQLDDAEAAYKEALKLEPGNPLAARELAYIAHLKAGGAKAPGEMTTPAKVDANTPGQKPI